MKKIRGFVFFLFLVRVCSVSFAQDFLHDTQKLFFDESMKTRRFGIEIEIDSISNATLEHILTETFHAQPILRNELGEVTFESPIGEIKLKIEGQAWRYEEDPVRFAEQQKIDMKSAPREIVLPPVIYDKIDLLENLCNRLKDAGARGTRDDLAVSTQVNVEMPNLLGSQTNVDNLVNLMRINSKPEHIEQIASRLKVPPIRQEYLKDFSPGFMNVLLNRNYAPTARELFDDYFYRQSLEVLGVKEAWTMDLVQAKRLLLAQPDPVVPQVIKMQRLRVSSLLLYSFPEDPLSKLIVTTRWARPAPLVEFREGNTDFKIRDIVEQTLGEVRSAEKYGYYDHDYLISELTGIDPRDLKILRKGLETKNIVHYALYDPKTNYVEGQNEGIKDAIWLSLSPNRVAAKPLVLSGETIVFHRRHIHKNTLLGKYNPGLENELIQQAMENKVFEASIFEKYAPGTMPRSVRLKDIIEIGKQSSKYALRTKIKKTVAAASRKFKNGWVMKFAWDLGSERMFISDQTDFEKILVDYEDGFERFKARVLKKLAGSDPEDIQTALSKHAGYQGYRILEMLKNPAQVFFQERENIKREFRVEAQGGRVLSNGSTVDRFSYERGFKISKDQLEHNDSYIRVAESFVQSVLDHFPEPLRYMPYGFDIALLEDGRYIVIESNPGGNSSFLEENQPSLKALDQYLKTYPDKIKKGEIKLLSGEAQIEWLNREFKSLKISKRLNYPKMKFTKNDIIDEEFKVIEDPKMTCQDRLLGES